MRLAKGRALRALDLELLRAVLGYDAETGALVWKERTADLFIEPPEAVTAKARKWNARFAGKPAFTARAEGYRRGRVLGVGLLAHRVAWAIHHGCWSEEQIDHINGIRDDNRIANLREVRDGENGRNAKRHRDNRSGATGVRRIGERWGASLTYCGRYYHLGTFDTKEAAIAVRKVAERRFGFHPNHGRDG